MRRSWELLSFVAPCLGLLVWVGPSGCGSDTTSGTSSSSGPSGSGGATSSSTPSNNSSNLVAIGGCYDSGGCDVPRDDGTIGGCVSCEAETGCVAQTSACDASADCSTIRACVVSSCADASCVASCSAMSPGGAQLYRDLIVCAYCGCNDPSPLCQAQLAALTPPGMCGP